MSKTKPQVKPSSETFTAFRLKADSGGYAVMKLQIGIDDGVVRSINEVHPSDTLAIASAILIREVRKSLCL